MKAFENGGGASIKETPEHTTTAKVQPKIGVTLRRSESSKRLMEDAHRQVPQSSASASSVPAVHDQTSPSNSTNQTNSNVSSASSSPSSNSAPSPPVSPNKKKKIGFQMVKKKKSVPETIIESPDKNHQTDETTSSTTNQMNKEGVSKKESPFPSPKISFSEPNETPPETYLDNQHQNGEAGSGGGDGQSDAFEAIQMARQAMRTSSMPVMMDSNSTTASQENSNSTDMPPPNILRRGSESMLSINSDGDGAPPPPPDDGGTPSGTSSTRSTPNGGLHHVKTSIGLSRFKIVASLGSDMGDEKSSSGGGISGTSVSERPRVVSASPSRTPFRPSLKAGQQAIQDIERKQWLVKKQQQESAQRMLDINTAKNKACQKTPEMNAAMQKLNSILNPNSQSDESIHALEEKAEGVLSRIKQSLQEATLGGYDDEDYSDRLDQEPDEHQKNADRGKELILRLSQNAPIKYKRSDSDGSLNEEEEDSNEENDEDGEEEGHVEKAGQSGMFGNGESVSMKWQGPVTVDRLTDDAEEMANSRGLSGQKATYASLCSVLIIDGLGNVAASGWEEKFISLSDSKLWAAAYFSVEGGTISTLGNAGRFNCVADLRSPGVSVVFEQCSHTSTGFCIAVRTLSAFTIKLAPKRFKILLEWGAALSQAINELPSLVELPTNQGVMYHARPSLALGVMNNITGTQDYQSSNFNHVPNMNSGPNSVAGSEVSTTDKSWVESYRKQKAMRRGAPLMA
eukprot:CAMPEP_0114361688 /NCGR_PEP_ID=MMETSP0101-20121206/24982_1 /TAXON_ID=38822 ORGANISM="Pteridomonas danica, Strain PT" /NCGR_SAMPLE_ID=MMETSP0101 /ASSEMBLY_ACC=CAM_ASM_000211 /LENGTH=739 /DNA_ID=CAMNT_0001506911 /DNA_START=54 /DNA_END=2273 /DNA_ORIENTATION=+